MKFKCSFQDCFGIKKMECDFDFTEHNVFAIYAKNGLMKTSFTKIFSKIREGKTREIKDLIFNKKGNWKILNSEGKDFKFTEYSLFVIKSIDDKYRSKYLSSLLVDENIKNKLSTLLDLRNELFFKLKDQSGLDFDEKMNYTSPLESAILKDLDLNNDSFLIQINNICENIQTEISEFNNIRYNQIFDKSILKRIEDKDFQDHIENLLVESDKIYNEYRFLKNGSFSYQKLKDIAEKLKKNNYFVNENKILLNKWRKIGNDESLDELIREIDEKIKSIPSLSSIEKILKGTTKTNDLRDIIENNPQILSFLKVENLNSLKKKLWISYIKQDENLFNKLKTLYQNVENEINYIDENNKTKWEEALSIFEKRFHTPYKMIISNKKSSIIGENFPSVLFSFKNDGNDEISYDHDKLNELDVLSQGEKRSLYLLNIIFDIEKLKLEIKNNKEKEILIIIDDIADSFDYKNKYAIIEYLYEISKIPNFKLIILTHNFDFYRTICLRLGIKKMLFAESKGNEIELKEDTSSWNPFAFWLSNIDSTRFLALIPFIRNIIDFGIAKSKDNKDKKLLISLIHVKEKSRNVKINDLKKILKSYTSITDEELQKLKLKDDDYVLDAIHEQAKLSLNEDISSLNLEYKIVLSIAIRLKAEEYMIEKLKEKGECVDNIKSNQTRELFNLFLNNYSGDNSSIMLLNKVLIITPENIHLNSFMYEPLMDIEFWELKELYKELLNITNNSTINK